MDPALRRFILRQNTVVKPATASTPAEEITAILRLNAGSESEVKQLEEKLQIKILAVVAPNAKSPDQTWLATCRLPINRIEEVRGHNSVLSLKASQRLIPSLRQTLDDIAAVSPTSDEVQLGCDGEGVIIGIIDFGMDFAHRNFCLRDGQLTSRILAIWDQATAPNQDVSKPGKPGKSPDRFGYGTEHRRKDINEALATSNPYETLGYAPNPDSIYMTGSHGTYVADIAAGNGNGTNQRGVAPKAEIIFVDVSNLPAARMPGSSFGDTVQLIEAVQYIFDKAGDYPCVINISLGTNGGPHDGSTLVEMAIDRLINERPNRAVVISAGNFYQDRTHIEGVVTDGGSVDVVWKIPKFDSTANEMEIWYSGDDRFTVEIETPKGHPLITVEPGREAKTGLLTVINRLHDPNNGDNQINIFFGSEIEDGEWTIRLYGTDVKKGNFHAWIERDEHGQAAFVESQDESYKIEPGCTLSSIAGGRNTIVVGSYDARAQAKDPPISRDSSAGPTRDGRLKPEISAPGEQVLAARSRTEYRRYGQSGTSLSAAAITGVVALMMVEAKQKNIDLTADKIREILIRKGVRKKRLEGKNWHRQYGYGQVSAAAAVREVKKGCT